MLLPVVLTLIATSTNDNKIVESISELCYTRWALEAFVVSNAQRFANLTSCYKTSLQRGTSLHLVYYFPYNISDIKEFGLSLAVDH